MAVILIDSGVVIDLSDPESAWFEWSVATLERLDQNNTLVINPIIYAECSIGFERIEEVEVLFEHLGFVIRPIPKEALFLAGKAFLQYKKRQGGKSNVLPDFFIGAHAVVANYRLMTRDRGRFSTYFPSVELIMPNSANGLNR
ncbi:MULTISPECIES: type II toxin-antitoxin system VapC family toxin [Methylomicrobium]|uniref:Putative nucleic acid-binding protein n=1 Tax=Methylomicrobium album BG8 TaxID=686340 RepID=H8GMV0_METAL|nr:MULTISPECIES: type II toxin-antitoxin system VapC family toxin [Methylomicrobium]EIC29502.1 putative nucleic acid-binding protein [Methylomicrobium album BG8]